MKVEFEERYKMEGFHKGYAQKSSTVCVEYRRANEIDDEYP
jgi:hypothetical protein